jgi:hypothetical protein
VLNLWSRFWEWLLRPPQGWGTFYTEHPVAARAWYLSRLVAALGLMAALCLLLFSCAYILLIEGRTEPEPVGGASLQFSVFALYLFNGFRFKLLCATVELNEQAPRGQQGSRGDADGGCLRKLRRVVVQKLEGSHEELD